MQNLPASIRTTSVNGLALILLTGLCLFSFSYQLGEVPPYHTDENFYVLSAKNMLQSGDYLTPMFHEKKTVCQTHIILLAGRRILQNIRCQPGLRPSVVRRFWNLVRRAGFF